MLKSAKFNYFGAACSIALALITGGGSLVVAFPDGSPVRQVFEAERTIPTYSILLALIGLFVAAAAIVHFEVRRRVDQAHEETERRLREDHRAALHYKSLELRNMERALDSERLKSRTDLITGIPNQYRWNEDFPSMARGRSLQIIMLDLLDFGSVNKRYGHLVGDEVLRSVAHQFHGTIRRSEEVFKHHRQTTEAELDPPAKGDVYRRYNRGDEFIFLVEGQEVDAIGFLVRLMDKKPQIDLEIRRAVQEMEPDLVIEYEFDFIAGVASVVPTDTPEVALSRVDDCLLKARQCFDNRKVFWQSRLKPDDFEAGDYRRGIYAKAAAAFRKEKNLIESVS